MRVVCPGYVETWVHYPKVPGSADAVLAEAATISGQVVFGKTGQPAAVVVVTLQSGGPQPLVRSLAETGPDGRYRFDTLPEGTFALWVSSAPGELNAPFVEKVEARRGGSTQAPLMRLVKGGEIRGRVVDDVAGRPAVGITVNLQGLLEQEGPARGFFASTTSDGLGQYRFTGLPSGKFNVFLFDVFLDKTGTDVTAAALESLPVECSQMTTAPPIHLIRGGVLKGRVIDDATGKPLVLHDGEKLGVRIYGPTRPWSGGACHYAIVNKEGTFEMRLPPGQSSLLLTTLSGGMLFNPTGNDGGEVTVPDGGEVHVEYHVTRMKPPKDADDKTSEAQPAATEAAKVAEFQLDPDDIGGTCSEKGKPISGVDVDLYQLSYQLRFDDSDQRFVARTSTNEAGQFVFRHVWPPKPRDGRYALVFRSKGLATELRSVVRRSDCAEIKLRPAAKLMGIVKDRQGKPVDGALVFPFFDRNVLFTPILGIRCAKTDAKGVFVINDLEEYKYIEPNVPVEMRIATHLRPRNLIIQHPDYEGTPVPYTQVPGGMDIELAKGAVITGLVVDGKTGRPAPGITVGCQGIHKQGRKADSYGTTGRTDQNGRYWLTSLPEGKFNVSVRGNPPGLASAALDSFEVRQGQTVDAPPIRLIKGGLIKGRLIDDATGQPITLRGDEEARIAAHGPARPRSGGATQGTRVEKDGTFEIRLPPGTNWVYLSGRGTFDDVGEAPPIVGEAPPGFGQIIHEIKVAEGGEYNIEFRVMRVFARNKGNDKETHTEKPVATRVVDAVVRPTVGAKQPPRTAVGRFAGMVRLEGKAPDPDLRPIRDGSLRINKTADNGIAGSFVYLAQAPRGTVAAVPPQPFILRSDTMAFSPRAGIARVGQTLILENDGRRLADFQLLPYRNPGINHAVGPGQKATFDAPFTTLEQTPFEIRDGAHPWMRAVLLVVDHPFAAVTDETGAFEIADLPAGKYSFRVWQERTGFLDKELTVDIKRGETTKRTLSYRFDRFEQ